MGLLGLIKDVVLLPVDIALDVTMITPMKRFADDCNGKSKHEQSFGTASRLGSIVENLEDSIKK